MLNAYKIDPAFNKNLVFAYQPPPVIDASKLPVLDENWLDDLQKITCETNSNLPKNIFDNHLGETFAYRAMIPLREQLKLIYHRLQGNLDLELGKLLPDDHLALINTLTEEIIYCSEGFHNRVNIIVESFHKPRNLAELLYLVRKKLVEKVALMLTKEIHAWNRVSVVAASDGLGVKANFSDDSYVGTLPESKIRGALQYAFYKKFTPFRLPSLLIDTFREFIPELEIEKTNKHGISLQLREEIIRLIKRFLPECINQHNDENNWKNYFELYQDKKNPLHISIVDINWGEMYRSFFDALSKQSYFESPKIHTLLDSAYHNLLFREKTSHTPTGEIISSLFKSERYSELLEQLVELKARFPDYCKEKCKIKLTDQYCSSFIDYLTKKLKNSSQYSEEIMQGFQFIIHLNSSGENFFIGKIANTLLENDLSGSNLLMLAAKDNPDLVNGILVFLKTHENAIDQKLIEKMFLMKNKDHLNVLMVAATYQIKIVKWLLEFLTHHIKYFSGDTIYELVFKKNYDQASCFVLGCNIQKSVLSVITQIGDRTAIHALLEFINKHIELLGIKVLAELLTEKNNQENYIFQPYCSQYPFTLKNVLRFIAHSANYEALIPIQSLSAYFIFEQFARWSIETSADEKLLDKVILNCSALLLIYFNKDYFAKRPHNLKIVTDKLFSCYLNELEDRKIKKITYTSNFSFFKWRYSTAQKLAAAQSLEKVLETKDIDKEPALLRIKDHYPALSESRLGNLFAAYQEINTLTANDVYEVDLENDAMHPKLALLA